MWQPRLYWTVFEPLLLTLALAQPVEIFEEWSLLDSAPLTQALVVRALYRTTDGVDAALSESFSETMRPEAYAGSATEPLRVDRVGTRWHVRLPPGRDGRVRITARAVSTLHTVRAFSLLWPQTRGWASRRVAITPNGWVLGVGQGWSCADDEVSTSACVSIDRVAPSLHVRVSPAKRGRWAWQWSTLAALLVFAAWRAIDARDRVLFAIGMVGVVPFVALTLAASRTTGWAEALSVCALMFATPIAVAVSRPSGRVAGVVSMLAVALYAVFVGEPRSTLAGAVVLSLVAMAQSLLTTKR
ncbi:MAG: hypothetical protein Q8Q09_21030 [Deltaproteobacteria bacterium]|nr:hypothetical protein [Deltaproteobacteria bacterium]